MGSKREVAARKLIGSDIIYSCYLQKALPLPQASNFKSVSLTINAKKIVKIATPRTGWVNILKLNFAEDTVVHIIKP